MYIALACTRQRRYDEQEMSDAQRGAGPDRPTNPNATRDHLANERTLLAWVRSCIAIVALGFVVARFGLLLRELGHSASVHSSVRFSTGFGVALILCGAGLVVLATLRYRATARGIEENTYQPSQLLLLLSAAGFVVVAVALAIYLFATA